MAAFRYGLVALSFFANLMLINRHFITILDKTKTENYGSAFFIKIEASIININPDGKGLSRCLMKDKAARRHVGFGVKHSFHLSFVAEHVFTSLSISFLLLAGDVAINPGPCSLSGRNVDSSSSYGYDYAKSIKCLLMNARSIVNKAHEFNTLTYDYDAIGVTETWLKSDILDSEILPSIDFDVHRRDRADRRGGGVMLAVRSNIPCVRRHDLESNAEILACELRPKARGKLLMAVFYRPPSSDINYLKQFKAFLKDARKNSFDSIIVLGYFNLPYMDWTSISPTVSDKIHTYFAKLIKDNFLWQLIDFPTRGSNILDLVLTTIPYKINNIAAFDSIIATDHKLIEFEINLKIPKQKQPTKRILYNFKNADWRGLK